MNHKEVNIAVVSRSKGHSPNLVEADEKIICAVLELLRGLCFMADLYTEEEFLSLSINHNVVISMCRQDRSLVKLQCMEDNGALVINTASSIKNCTRRNLIRIFEQENIPVPESIIVKTSNNQMPFDGEFFPCWLKLPDFPTVKQEDILFATTPNVYFSSLSSYRERGIEEVLISRHLNGDLVKFYAVPESCFLYTSYPQLSGHSKFGYEKNNDPLKYTPFRREYLSKICSKVSLATGISVFGGDCIIDSMGRPCIIDINDWPSFSSCTQDAARSIVQLIEKKIRERGWCNA